MVFFGSLLVERILQYPSAFSPLTWALEVVFGALYVYPYLVRSPVRGRARGFSERYLPFLVPPCAFRLWAEPMTHPELRAYALPLLILGDIIACLALWNLRRSFSVMVEARCLVSGGIYRFVRHPTYLGGIVACFGGWLLRISPTASAWYLLFVIGEAYRAVLEERKLRYFCPAYAAYQARVPMFGVRLPRHPALIPRRLEGQ